MRLTKRTIIGSIGALGLLLIGRTAAAQCSAWTCNGASNIYTTTAHVGVGTSTPQDNMEVATGAGGRLRISSDDANHNGNGGVHLFIGNISQWSVASYTVGGPDIPINYFQIYDQPNGKNALLMQHGSNSLATFGGDVRPSSDNAYKSGGSSNRWTAVYAVNGTIQTSDARQKKDIAELKYGLKQVLKLRPVTFRWKTGPDKDTHLGLLAQDVEKVIPEVVKHGEAPSDALGMNYAELVPVLVASVQAQQKIIDEQQERISRLEHRSGIASNSSSSGIIGASLGIAALPAFGLVFAFRRRRRVSANG
jgi:MYXO-CTERM domain-containing protein